MNFSIPRFLFRVAAGALAILFILMLSAWRLEVYERQALAAQLANSSKTDLLIGDLRTAMVTLNASLGHDFTAIRFVGDDGLAQFELGHSAGWLDYTIPIPIQLSPGNQSKAHLQFSFSPWRYARNVAIIWLALVILNLPLLWILAKRLEKFYQKLSREQALAHIGQIARQLAHDIRSPLSALTALTPHLAFRSDEESTLYAQVLHRLESIADDILVREKSNLNLPAELIDPKDIKKLLLSVASERSLAWKSTRPLLVDFEFNVDCGARANAKEFSRIFSNILQNAWEAQATKIAVTVEDQDAWLLINVRDNGRGIPLAVLSKIGQEGFSVGKANGHGLGLFSARQYLTAWGGKLELSSAEGSGTKIQVWLTAR